jgi:hypothetical protein
MILLIDGKIEEVPDFTHAIEEAMEIPKPRPFSQWQEATK